MNAEARNVGNRITLHADSPGGTIRREVYGHFAEHLGRCIYDGFWVGPESSIPNTRGIRNDVVAALRAIDIPVLRWPGGCFADEYHWQDGIGPVDQRPTQINTHWGGVVESNHFGTHEFLDLCHLLGCEPYISANVGSGTVREMQQWVEYLTSAGAGSMANLRRANGREAPWSIRYWGVGNENWGCGGNMRPEYYADVYRRFATYCRDFDGNRLYKIACGSGSPDTRWTEVLMREAARYMDGLSLHYYTVPGTWEAKGSATQFDEAEWFTTLRKALLIDDVIADHSGVMDQYDPERRVGLIVDEWGTWFDVEPGTPPGFLFQQNSLRDALVAGVTLNILNSHCDRVHMANLAQTVNVLQAQVLTDGAALILTPTYHVFELYKVHQGATLLPTEVRSAPYTHGEHVIPALNASASRETQGRIHLSLCNLDASQDQEVVGEIIGARPAQVSARVLTAAALTAHNTAAQPAAVQPSVLEGVELIEGGWRATVPAKSVVVLAFD